MVTNDCKLHRLYYLTFNNSILITYNKLFKIMHS